MMLRGLWKLTWIEIKIFLREPLVNGGVKPGQWGGAKVGQ